MNQIKGNGTMGSPYLPDEGEKPTHFLARVFLKGAEERNTKPMFAKFAVGEETKLVSITMERPEQFQGHVNVVANDVGLQQALEIKPGYGRDLWYWNTKILYHVLAVEQVTA